MISFGLILGLGLSNAGFAQEPSQLSDCKAKSKGLLWDQVGGGTLASIGLIATVSGNPLALVPLLVGTLLLSERTLAKQQLQCDE